MKTYGWYFCGATLRDGRPIPPDGEWLIHKGKIKMCESGLHYSPTPFDALRYAPGGTLCYVEVEDVVKTDDTKGVCRRRKILARMDAIDALRYFARMQALSVVHLWDAPDVVLDWLMTGDEGIRAAARAATWDAMWDATWGAVGEAAWDATWGAVGEAAWDAARAAARAAAWDAAWDAAWADFNTLIYECFEGVMK